jgi:multiple sugar transport system substrate-binding protein
MISSEAVGMADGYLRRSSMTKKSKLAALAVIPLALLLAACSAPSGPSQPAPLDPDMEATLTIWTYDQEERDSTVQTEMFEKLYPNVTIETIFVPQEQFANKIISSATTQDGPDIIWYNPAYTQAFGDSGTVLPLTDYWAAYEDADQFPDSVLNRAGDDIFGVQSYVNLIGLWYNQTILDAIGVEVPTTLDELEDAMAAASAAGHVGMQIPGTPGIEGEWISKPFFTGYGIDDYSQLGDPGTEQMFERLSGWVNDGYINRGDLGLSQGDGLPKFLEGNTAFFVGGNWQLGAANEATFEWGVTPMPDGPDGEGIVYLGGQAEAIGAFTENPDLAWEFLRTTWLTQEFETAALERGSIPARADAVPTDADARIKAYSDAVAKGVPLSADTASTLAIGDLWSAVLSGQTDPAGGAATAKQIAQNAE